MVQSIVLCFLFLAAAAAGTLFVLRRRFIARLRQLEDRLTDAPPILEARDDLQPEVVALAERQGAQRSHLAPVVRFEQTGVMWSSPEAKDMRFSACQTMAAVQPGFVWRATFAPAGLVLVADYFGS